MNAICYKPNKKSGKAGIVFITRLQNNKNDQNHKQGGLKYRENTACQPRFMKRDK